MTFGKIIDNLWVAQINYDDWNLTGFVSEPVFVVADSAEEAEKKILELFRRKNFNARNVKIHKHEILSRTSPAQPIRVLVEDPENFVDLSQLRY